MTRHCVALRLGKQSDALVMSFVKQDRLHRGSQILVIFPKNFLGKRRNRQIAASYAL